MTEHTPNQRLKTHFLFNPTGTLFQLLLSLLFGGLFSLWRGQIWDWDAMNYHYYNAWAFLRNPGGVDIFGPAEHAFLSPFVEVPYYLIGYEWFPDYPRVVVFLAGLPLGLLVFLTALCTHKILSTYGGIGKPLRCFYTLLLSFFGLSGCAVMSQVGWRSNEIEISCFVLGGFLIFLYFNARNEGKEKSLFHACVFSGILLGIAPGLKLTALTFTVPFLLGILFYYSTWRERIKAFFLFSVGWWLAFLLVYGWWGWRLWQLTGNPFFPALNNIFHSDWCPPGVTLDDTRFGPKSLRRALFFPFYWTHGKSVLDWDITEFRFLFAYGTICVWSMFFILRKIVKKWMQFKAPDEENWGALPPTGRLILVFCVFSYLLWTFQFSILRYLVPVSCLLGSACFVCIFPYHEKSTNWRGHVFAISLLGFFTTASVLSSREYFPYYGPQPETKQFKTVELPILRESTLVLSGLGTSFLVPMLHGKNPTMKYIGNLRWTAWNRVSLRDIGDCALKREIVKVIRNHHGPICVLMEREERILPEEVSPFGVSLNKSLFTRVSVNKGEAVFNLYYADNKNAEKETNVESQKYFIENVMKNTPRVTHEDFHLFTTGVHVKAWKYWKKTEREYIWFGKEKTVVEVFLKNPEKLKRTLTIKGTPRGLQQTVIKVNGKEIFSGEVPAGGFKELIVPEGVLQVGENQVEFNWPNACPAGRGDNRIVAFAFKELFLE
jgi:hypothetical protein